MRLRKKILAEQKVDDVSFAVHQWELMDVVLIHDVKCIEWRDRLRGA